MSFKEKMRGIFKSQATTETQKEKQTLSTKTGVTSRASGIQKEMQLNELVSTLDIVSQGLSRRELSEENVEKYSIMLNQMKEEVSGLQSVLLLEDLYKSLYSVISITLRDVLFSGDISHVDIVKEAIHEGIRALPGTEKEQTIASINIEIVILKGKVWLFDSSISTLRADRAGKEKQLEANPFDQNLQVTLENIETYIGNLNQQKRVAITDIASLEDKKKQLQHDTLGVEVTALFEEIQVFIDALPSAEDQILATERFTKMGDNAISKRIAESKAMKNAIDACDVELSTDGIAASKQTASGMSEEISSSTSESDNALRSADTSI